MAENKPPEDEPKSARFNMFISPSEMEAIDEWAWQNRIRSKSEAVRRLCKIALFLGAEFEQIIDVTTDGVTVTADLVKQSVDERRLFSQPHLKDALFSRDEVLDLLDAAAERTHTAFTGIQGLHELVVAIFESARPYAEAQTLSKGEEQAERRIAEANAAMDAAAHRREEAEENRYIAIWSSHESREEREAYEALPEDDKDAFILERVAALKNEEDADPERFAAKYGIRKPFWEVPGWEDRLLARKTMPTVDEGNR